MAYFDWNATAPLVPEGREAWLEAVERFWANPSSAHRPGVQAKLALEEAREYLAAGLGVEADQLIFTSGATESIGGFLNGICRAGDNDAKIWISEVEHPAVRETALSCYGPGRVETIPVNRDGALDLNWIEDNLKERTPGLVSVMAANNETGVLYPWEEIREMCRSRGVAFFCDAVQWIGKMPFGDWQGCAGVSLSGHKFGGPKGVGCLVMGKDWRGLKLQSGGSQELDSRAGTENVAGILAMTAAFRKRTTEPVPSCEARDYFETALADALGEDFIVNGKGSDRLWNTSSVSLPQFRSERWITQLDRLGFQVSSGSACTTGEATSSKVLLAMGLKEERIRRTIRISGGWETEASDWKALLETILQVRDILIERDESGRPGKVIKI